jgi:hypothetical protein
MPDKRTRGEISHLQISRVPIQHSAALVVNLGSVLGSSLHHGASERLL